MNSGKGTWAHTLPPRDPKGEDTENRTAFLQDNLPLYLFLLSQTRADMSPSSIEPTEACITMLAAIHLVGSSRVLGGSQCKLISTSLFACTKTLLILSFPLHQIARSHLGGPETTMANTKSPLKLDAALPERPQEEPDSSSIKQSHAQRQADDSGKWYGYPEPNYNDTGRFSDGQMGNGQSRIQGRRRRRRRRRGRPRASPEIAPPQADSVSEDDENDQAQPETIPSDGVSPVSGNVSPSQLKIVGDQEPNLQQDLSRSPTEPEATDEQSKTKNESWRQPEGEKDITKFRFPVKGDGSLLRYLREPRRPAINWGPLMGGRRVEYKKLP
ncbi:uncharacterized protein NECHADRAFT_85160 [Fusarium vanettenii 77-13-4]|uniref:Uncharacterized protein n=1 Tax=Fusarium vanettenii (strain ATCC MYA-4622 / CBS 123669 / FGSC 9596 / NRRL 45880 / 77-13-4) TaxID=660122 RepID=C7YV58_FUSV7|nr:uncharacterized protein NECHADRAFT_85160 [Fusarium vanettenii 77-13-4]EEU44928.1 predicted protein [Fusarium vanettenii 77-13-4]